MIVYIDTECKQYFGEIYNPFEDLDIKQVKELIDDISDSDKLWFYGYRKKTIIYVWNNTVYQTVVLIKRLVWVSPDNHRQYIYLYPSFAMKRCPFSLDTIEQLYIENVSNGADALDGIEDPYNLLESSDRLMNWIIRLTKRTEDAELLENVCSSYLKILQVMPKIDKSLNDYLHQLIDVFGQLMEYIKCPLLPYTTLAALNRNFGI
jgi:hypothetical protein